MFRPEGAATYQPGAEGSAAPGSRDNWFTGPKRGGTDRYIDYSALSGLLRHDGYATQGVGDPRMARVALPRADVSRPFRADLHAKGVELHSPGSPRGGAPWVIE